MAFDRSERGRRWEQHPRRGESEGHRIPRNRGEYDRDYYEGDLPDQDADYRRPSERHWRGHDYGTEEEFERGRNFGGYGRERERTLGAEHRYRFLRSDDKDRYGRGFPQPWRQESSFSDSEPWRGPYVGRGPKGYRRSDERIYEEVCERLTEHPSIDASDIEVSVGEGDVTLAGQVESRAVKHLTESMVETVPGVKEVHNQLRVVPPQQDYSWRVTDERNEPRAQEATTPKSRRR